MDFRYSSEHLSKGIIEQEEIITQIINLPCLYSLHNNFDEIFYLDVINESSDEELSVPLLYSNYEFALEALQQFKLQKQWSVKQWTDIVDILRKCREDYQEGIAFDSLPNYQHLGGLVIDKESVNQLIQLCC